MKAFILIVLLAIGSRFTAESATAHATPTQTSRTTIGPPPSKGVWGIFKGKKHRKPRPAYQRLR